MINQLLESDAKEASAAWRFKKLATAWKSETRFFSNVTDKVTNANYYKIIGMGESAIPFILDDLLVNGPNDWFWALTAITDENPITREFAGDMAAMTEAWLLWGRKAGYLKNYPQTMNGSSQT